MVSHRDDQQRAVRHPAEPRRLGLDRHDLLRPSLGVERHHLVAVEVGDPPATLVPARSLEERSALEKRLALSLRHRGGTLPVSRYAEAVRANSVGMLTFSHLFTGGCASRQEKPIASRGY